MLFYKEAKRVFDAEDYEYEIVFVNDGSKDKTQEELEKVYNLHEANIVIEMFSRNFWKRSSYLRRISESIRRSDHCD